MNERQLNYFIAVAEDKSFSKAAAHLPISLSALSRQIQSLEEELGTELFIRTGNGLELTAAGHTMMARAIPLRRQIESIRQEVQRAGKQVMGRLDIGGFGAVSLVYLPQILKAFKTQHPNIDAVVHTGPATLHLENLRQGRISAYFDRIQEIPAGCSAELAFPDTLVLALPDGHPLCEKSEICLEDLRGQPIIGRQDERNHPPELRTMLEQLDFQLNIVQRVQDMVTSASMVACGLGITFLASAVQKLHLANVAFRPLRTDARLGSDIYCVHRQDDRSPIVRALLNVVRSYRADMQCEEAA
ncbi:MAG: LysR substrate-binding domain-containing protein [Rhodocyclaceae bacterium]